VEKKGGSCSGISIKKEMKEINRLKEKIALFQKNLSDYKSKNYDEYSARADFIDSLFSAFCFLVLRKDNYGSKF